MAKTTDIHSVLKLESKDVIMAAPLHSSLTALSGLLTQTIMSSLLGDLPVKHRGVASSKFSANLQHRKPYKSEEL